MLATEAKKPYSLLLFPDCRKDESQVLHQVRILRVAPEAVWHV